MSAAHRRVVVVSALSDAGGAWDIWMRELGGATGWTWHGSPRAFRRAVARGDDGRPTVLAGLSVHHTHKPSPCSAHLASRRISLNSGAPVRAYDIAAISQRLFHESPAEITRRLVVDYEAPSSRVLADAHGKWALLQPYRGAAAFTYAAAALAMDHLFGADLHPHYTNRTLSAQERDTAAWEVEVAATAGVSAAAVAKAVAAARAADARARGSITK